MYLNIFINFLSSGRISVKRLAKNKLVHNTSMLYILNASKLLFPFLTFPYLTRVLSVEGYAVLVYVKAMMSYMLVWIAFGFMLSATKRVVQARKDIFLISSIVSNTIFARFLLGLAGGVIVLVCSYTIPLLRQNLLFTWLSYIPVFLTCFITDFLFRGLEKMHEITLRFVTMKGISTALTFVFVHSDKNLLLIPILDIFSSIVALILIYIRFAKYNVHLVPPSLCTAWRYIKESCTYFLSSAATTAFGALNTLLIGVYLPESDVAIWAVALQLIMLIQMCYGPITDGIYPEMIRNQKLALIKKIAFLFMPIVFVGCMFCYVAAPFIIRIASGNKYMAAVPIFRLLLPVLFFSFPAILCGWPALGAIGKVKQTTCTTIAAACIQVSGLAILIVGGQFTLPLVALLRGCSESLFFTMRFYLIHKYRAEFK